jgi:hypothetical protein
MDMCCILLHKKVRPVEVSKGNVKGVNIYDKEGKKIDEKVKDGKLDPLSKMGKSKLTGSEIQRYYRDNPKQKAAARDKTVKNSDKDTINDESCDLLIPYMRAVQAGWFTEGAAYNNCRPLKDIF